MMRQFSKGSTLSFRIAVAGSLGLAAAMSAVGVDAQDMSPEQVQRQFADSKRQTEEFLEQNCSGNVSESNQSLCNNARESLRMAEKFMAASGQSSEGSGLVNGSQASPRSSTGTATAATGDPTCVDPAPRLSSSECDQIDGTCTRVVYKPYKAGDRMELPQQTKGMLPGKYICVANRGWQRVAGM